MSLHLLFSVLEDGGDIIAFDAASYVSIDVQTSPDDADSGFEFDTDGTINKLDSDGDTADIGTWSTSINDETDYDFMLLDDDGGDAVGAASKEYDTWYNGAAMPLAWYVEVTGIGTNQLKGTFRIRPAGGGDDIDTATVSSVASVEP